MWDILLRALGLRHGEHAHLVNQDEDDEIGLLEGLESYTDLKTAEEIITRRNMGLSVDDIEWSHSDNPLHPANNPFHPLYIRSKGNKR